MSQITKEEVKYLAELSRIKLSEEEIEKITGEIDSILGYVSQIKEASGQLGEKEKPLLRNVMREDKVTHKPEEFSEKLLEIAPDREGNYLKVKKIL